MNTAAIPFRFGPATRRLSHRSVRQLRAIFANLRGRGTLARGVAGENAVRKFEATRWRRVQPVMAARGLIDIVDIKGPATRMIQQTRTYLDNLVERTTKQGARLAARAARQKIWNVRNRIQQRYLTNQTDTAIRKIGQKITREFGVDYPGQRLGTTKQYPFLEFPPDKIPSIRVAEISAARSKLIGSLPRITNRLTGTVTLRARGNAAEELRVLQRRQTPTVKPGWWNKDLTPRARKPRGSFFERQVSRVVARHRTGL